MSELPQNGRPIGRGSRDANRALALRSATLVCLIILATAAAVGQLSPWLLMAGVIGVALSGLLALKSIDSPIQPVTQKSSRDPGVAEAVLAHIPDPVILVDRRGIVIEANEAARFLLPSLSLGHPLSFSLRSPVVLDGIGTVLSSRVPLRVEYTERTPTERSFEVHVGLLQREGKDLEDNLGIVLFFRDLTSARRVEAMRSDFVANASHELRTPLASLLGFIETLQGSARNDPEARERFLDVMRQQAQRMTRLVEDLLSLSRIEVRLHVHPTTTVDMVSIVSHMVEALQSFATDRGVILDTELPASPVLVLGDRDELMRLVENLITNAIKYGEGGGKVEVILSQENSPGGQGRAVLSVRDHGAGIAPEHLPRLTERFYRVDVEQSRDKGGTGLGLAIVKHIVNRHRGALEIQSEQGAGACFIVTLPLARG